MCFNKEKSLNPDLKYRARPMFHAYGVKDDPTALAKALKAYGYGGTVINPKFNDETLVTDEAIKLQYQQTAEGYRALIPQVETIDNINFRLNGFANGGLKSTYPTKIRWEKACGGKKAFKELLKEASAVSANDGKNFGIYPDFDFMYINYTDTFDGIRIKGNVSRMVDNRYASKQVYSSVTGEYDTIYAMIVSPDALDRLYDKFIKKYGKYDATGISVSTLGSDLNSNFDKDNPVSRDDAQGYVTALLD